MKETDNKLIILPQSKKNKLLSIVPSKKTKTYFTNEKRENLLIIKVVQGLKFININCEYSSTARILDCQSEDAGSIPVTRSINGEYGEVVNALVCGTSILKCYDCGQMVSQGEAIKQKEGSGNLGGGGYGHKSG
ncbi:17149_t:CDS:2 [Funneliformis geosporum]|nr:17149_t:CDS:2 [Funneliformis geosporum]